MSLLGPDRLRKALALAAAAACVLPVAALPAGAAAVSTPLTITTLSNRADLISGGDALLQLSEPSTVRLNGEDITSRFSQAPDGRVLGVVTGLKVGANAVEATTGTRGARLTITNHPTSGPVFSGPQLQPWTCQDTAENAACDEAPTYEFLYKSTDPTKDGLQPYDPAQPPSDVATTTTDEGLTVPFIVREERGYLNRDAYAITVLYRPDAPWTPAAPQEQWNNKLVIPGGANCGNDHGVASPPDVRYELALGRGFAVASHATVNLGHACNPVLAAEAIVMTKERLADQLGEIRYTIGMGCSGGSIVQLWGTNAYPGLYDGITASCTYPDVYTTLIQFTDYNLLRGYFEEPAQWAPGVAWTEQQMAKVAGHVSYANVIAGDTLFVANIIDPTAATCRPVPQEDRYAPGTNPDGVRCGLNDFNINLLGLRDQSVWSASEQAVGRSFAASPYDGIGVQYGLEPLREGLITPEMFTDLNEKIGGHDLDFQQRPERTVADPSAIANAYRTGLANTTSNLDQTPIISMTGFEPAAAHDVAHAFWVRDRLVREHGDHDNHVMWHGPIALVGDTAFADQAFLAMDEWLTAIEKDTSSAPLPDKVATNRPADLTDRCSDGAGNTLSNEVCPEPVLSRYGTPRTVAGMDKTADGFKCQLRPLNRDDDYGPLPMSDTQWSRLQAVYPTGVCDYTKAGVEQQPTVPWMTYGTSSQVIYGGQPLGAPPASIPFTAAAAAGTQAPGTSTAAAPAGSRAPGSSGTRLAATGAGPELGVVGGTMLLAALLALRASRRVHHGRR